MPPSSGPEAKLENPTKRERAHLLASALTTFAANLTTIRAVQAEIEAAALGLYPKRMAWPAQASVTSLDAAVKSLLLGDWRAAIINLDDALKGLQSKALSFQRQRIKNAMASIEKAIEEFNLSQS